MFEVSYCDASGMLVCETFKTYEEAKEFAGRICNKLHVKPEINMIKKEQEEEPVEEMGMMM